MEKNIYSFEIDVDWQLISTISKLDRFDASWSSLERKEQQNLKQLKTVATVSSVGASTRIEGSRLSDEEVDILINEIGVKKFEDRDAQEVMGYFEVLDIISQSYMDIEISASSIKNLHNILMKHSTKDQWHKGDYKQHSNMVEAKYPDGKSQIIFRTTEPGFATEDAMEHLIVWYNSDQTVHPIVKCAIFTYEFLSIHPFQDGNGRLSRLISTWLLMKAGYVWIQYVSFEHEIEKRKIEYYQSLRNCQNQRPNENVTEWVNFFFDALQNVQENLLNKLQFNTSESQLLPREKQIAHYIHHNPGAKTKDISKSLGIPRQTIIRSITVLLEKKVIEKHGTGSGTYYTLL